MKNVLMTAGLFLNSLAFTANGQQMTQPEQATDPLAEMVLKNIQETKGPNHNDNQGTMFTMMGGHLETNTGGSNEYFVTMFSKDDANQNGKLDPAEVKGGRVTYYTKDAAGNFKFDMYDIKKTDKGFNVYSTRQVEGVTQENPVPIGKGLDLPGVIKKIGTVTSQQVKPEAKPLPQYKTI